MKYICLGIFLACMLQSAAAATFDSQTKVPLPPGAESSFAAAVAVSGNTFVAGAPYEDGDLFAAGAAYVFVNTNGGWTQQARLVSPEPLEFETFGSAVAVSGDLIVIGSYGDPYTQDGAAYVFVRTGETWSFAQRLNPSDPAPFQLFGFSVAANSDTLAVGALSDVGTETYAGAVYVFARSGGTWVEQQKLVAAAPLAGELLGYSVAIDGQNIAAGAPYADGFAGAAYVFSRNGSQWSQSARLNYVNATSDALMGSSIALSGNTLVAGAPSDENDLGSLAFEAGSAHVFSFDGASWSHAKLVASNPFPRRRFGQAVAINGDVVVVGADGEIDAFDVFTARGAYVFTRTAGAWAEAQQLTPPGAANTLHFFGSSVSMSGNRLVIGDSTAFPIDSAVYVFDSALNTAPTVTCAPAQQIDCVVGTAPVSLSVQVADTESDALTVIWSVDGVPFAITNLSAGITAAGLTLSSPDVALGVGSHLFEVSVSDATETVRCESTASLRADTESPIISSITATPGSLAQGGKPVVVQVNVTATDNCSAVTSRIVNVIVTDSGSGKPAKTTHPPYLVTGPLTVELDAQGAGGKKIRTYTLVIESSDAVGNVTSGSVDVSVQ
jgi:hypothetical protein